MRSECEGIIRKKYEIMDWYIVGANNNLYNKLHE